MFEWTEDQLIEILEVVEKSDDIAVFRLATDDFEIVLARDAKALSESGLSSQNARLSPTRMDRAETFLKDPDASSAQTVANAALEPKRIMDPPPPFGPITGQSSEPPEGADVKMSEDPGTIIRAPMIGTFFRSPEPGAPPFVEVGAEVEEGTTVGLVEAMKIFVAVPAGIHGIVKEILVDNEQFVEHGQPLIRLDPIATDR